MSTIILPETFQFLNLLKRNNNREWFNEHKQLYINAHENVIDFVDDIIVGLAEIDPEIGKTNAKKALYRIYRDTRFSHNKDPYKTNFGASLGMSKGNNKAGLYIHIEPNQSFIGGGIYQPESSVLRKIRQEISVFPNEFQSIIENPNFKNYFGKLSEESKLVKIPNGFDKEHPLAEYLKLKSLLAIHNLENAQLSTQNSTSQIVKTLQHLQPFIHFINTAIEEN